MLLCAFVLALTGSAWATGDSTGDSDVISADLLSFDEAVNAAISFDISADVISEDSRDVVFMVKLSIDAVASIDSGDSSFATVKVIASKDNSVLETFEKNQSIDVFVVGSGDVVKLDAFKLSKDTTTKSTDLLVAFPVVLFEKASGDMKVTSTDKKITSLTIRQNFSADVDVKGINPRSGDKNIVVAVWSNDKYVALTTSADFKIASNDLPTSKFAVVVSGDKKEIASSDFVEFSLPSFDVGDLVVVKFVTSNDKKNIAYGIIYSGDVSADVISQDKIWLDLVSVLSDEPEVKVAIYNASDDTMSKTMTFTRHFGGKNGEVSFDLNGLVLSGDKIKAHKVSFDEPSTWTILSLDTDYDIKSSDVTSPDKFTSFDFKGWFTSRDWTKKVTSLDIFVGSSTLYASYDVTVKTEEEKQSSDGSFDFTVKVTPSPTSVSVDKTFKLTATVTPTSIDLANVTPKYKWTWKNAKNTTAQTLSLDKDSGDVTATSAMYPSADFYVTVTITSGDTVSHDAYATVTILSADSGSGGSSTSSATLSTLAVTISPDKGTYDVSVNKADTIDLSLTVKATYSGDTTATDVTSTLGAKATWTLGTVSPTTTVFSLKNDSGATNTLNIASAITEGTYTVPVSVKVTSGDVSDDATVTYTIVASKSGGSGGGTPDSGDVTSGDVTSGDVTKEDAKEAVTEALKGKTNPSVTDLLGSTAAITAISKTVSSTGELDMSVLNGVTSLEGLATLLTNLGNVKSLNFADMGSSLTKIDNLDGVKLDSISLAGNTHITTVDLSGAQIPVVNAKGSSALTSVNVAGNTSIASLDIGETKVASLDVAGCTNLQDLEVDNSGTTGQGSLEELNIEGCVSLKNLTLTKNKLLGIKKPTGLKNTVAIKARNQRRPHTFTSASFNFWTFLWQTILGKTTAFSATTATFEPTRITVITYTVGTTTTSTDVPASGDVTLSGTPTGIAYEYDTSGFGPSTGSSLQSASVVAADDTGMDVTLGTVGSSTDDEESPTLGSSGGGCDAGFGLGALSAVMLMFALIKKRS